MKPSKGQKVGLSLVRCIFTFNLFNFEIYERRHPQFVSCGAKIYIFK